MIFEPICVAPTGDRCGEGVVWHEAHGAVYWTDINRFLIHRYTLADKCVRTWFFDEPVTALTLTDRDDVLVVVLGSGVILWEPASDVRRDPIFRATGWPQVRLNESRVDPCGSLWIGSMQNNVNPDGTPSAIDRKDGVLYRLDSDRIDCNAGATIHRTDIDISNTLAWSPDRRVQYFADCLANTIWGYDYDPATQMIANERPFLKVFHAVCRMVPRSMRKAICGTADITEAALSGLRPTAELTASLRCQ